MDNMRAVQADGHHDDAAEHGGDGGAVEAEVEAEDEDRVEDGGGDAAAQRDVHGAPGITDAAQDARGAHAERHQWQGWQDDLQEARGECERLAGRAEQCQQRAQERPGGEREAKRRGADEDQRGTAHARGFLALAAPDGARHQRARGDRQADRDRDGEEQQGRGEADRGREFLHAEQRDVEQVERIDDEDGDQPDRARAGHHHDVAHGRSGGEFRGVGTVIGLSHWTALTLLHGDLAPPTVNVWRPAIAQAGSGQ